MKNIHFMNIPRAQHGEFLLMGLMEAIGGCERIVRTTVPASYSRHTSRFLRCRVPARRCPCATHVSL